MKRSADGPTGFQWLWRLAYSHGFWRGFLTAFALTPVLMTVISFAWTSQLPPWHEQYKSFIVGDTLLAVACGLLAKLAALPSDKDFRPSVLYWNKWMLIGLGASSLFIAQEFIKNKLTDWWMLLQPHIFYHHIVVFTALSALLGGMAYVQYRRLPRNRLWIVILLLFVGYVGLVVYDNISPPTPRPSAEVGSPETWFLRVMRDYRQNIHTCTH